MKAKATPAAEDESSVSVAACPNDLRGYQQDDRAIVAMVRGTKALGHTSDGGGEMVCAFTVCISPFRGFVSMKPRS